MSNIIWILLLIVIVFIMVQKMFPTKGVASIGTDELQQRLKVHGNERPELIDVREPHEYKSGHVPGFRNVPLGQVKREVPSLPRDKEIVVMCRSGARSMQAVKVLKKSGFEQVTNVSGGILRWHGKMVK